MQIPRVNRSCGAPAVFSMFCFWRRGFAATAAGAAVAAGHRPAATSSSENPLTHKRSTDNPLFSLSGRVALVTGASRGLGLSMAQGLADAGAHVVLNSRKAADLEVVAAHIRENGGSCSYCAFDVTDRDAMQKGVEQVIATNGSIDILVNNAGK